MYFFIFILLINRKLLPLQQKYDQDTIRETLFPQLENYPRTSNGLRFFLKGILHNFCTIIFKSQKNIVPLQVNYVICELFLIFKRNKVYGRLTKEECRDIARRLL